MVLADLVAGTFAGFAICVVGHPFDTLKVLMQMQPEKYGSMAAAARETVAKHGFAGLYRGVASPLIGNGLYNAVQFAVFANIKRALTDDGRAVTLNRIAASGALTGIFVAFVEGPQDLFKSQMQAQMMTRKPAVVPVAVGGAGAASAAVAAAAATASAAAPAYTGTLDCARTILRQRGVAGPFQGLSATIARNFVGVSAYFYGYEATRMYQARATGKSVAELSSLQVLLAGGMGGLSYWVLSYPLDIIKSAIQTDAIDPARRRYAGFADTARKLWAEGGVKRYTAGLAPCLVRSFPANAAGFVAYEQVKRMMGE